ncbi:peptidase [Enterococcus sp. JM4C]|uniref:cell wall elongation regulator TseB-like domain-containing protein n=1 Tax=Candidatus Enterococcus huntleyi TaxID=1857217 RepID=UPI00137AA0E1|nr:DUF5590 domain-containing protein [Enterococcus sp. JM4C]KAF1297597.1 peptidase [Enterococcus sp. JM4C]
MNNEAKNEKRVGLILISAITVLLTIIVLTAVFYIRANRPMAQAKAEAVEIAEKYAQVKTVDQFYWFTRKETYFSVLGKDDKNHEVAVIISKSGDKVKVLNQKDGLSEQQAEQVVLRDHPGEAVVKRSLGIYENQPTWEIMTKDSQNQLTYYLLSFNDGKEIKSIKET